MKQILVSGASINLTRAGNTELMTTNTTGSVKGGIQSLSNQSVRIGSVTDHPSEIVHNNVVKAAATATAFTVSGQLGVSTPVGTNPALSLTHTGTGNATMCIFTQSASNSFNMAEWRTSDATSVLNFAASGNVTNTNNSYGAISDVKLKENIADASSQWDDIKAVKVRKYSFKTESSETANQLGVVAQELEASGMNGLVVDNIDRDPDTFEDLGTTTKEVKYSVLYMKAIKALQEAMARIETLETKVTALEG
jgi:hypothetical protein